jgi:hypothetical protein
MPCDLNLNIFTLYIVIKKIAFTLLLLSAIACGTWGYLYLTNLKRPTVNPLRVLPDSCYILIETRNLHQLTEKFNQGNLMWEELLKTEAIATFNKILQKADSLISNSSSISSFGVQSVFVALYQNKKAPLLAAFNLADINTNDLFISFLEKSFAAKKTNDKSTPVYECKQTDYTFYVYVKAGLVVLSGNIELLQEAIKNNKTSLAQNKAFTESYHASDKGSDLNVFIHLPFFYTHAWSTFFSEPLSNKNIYGINYEAWISLDADIKPGELNTQGFISNDSSAFYNTLRGQETINFKDVFSQLPYNTQKLQTISIRKYSQFIKNNCLANANKRTEAIQVYTDKMNADAQVEIEKFIGDYAVLFTARCNDTEQDYGLINSTDEKTATGFLKIVSDSVFEAADSGKIYYNARQNLFSDLCGYFFKQDFKYATYIDNGILFSNEVSALVEFKKSVSEKSNLLANDRIVHFIEKNLSAESAFLFYVDVFRYQKQITNAVSGNIRKLLEQAPEMLDKYESVALTMQKLKNNVFFKACANFNPKNKLYQNTLWETLLDTDLYMNPTPVKNHITNETELVCADIKNNIYLLSNTGKLLWKKNTGERILGEIHQVDYFNNNKLQLLFNTENYIYVIDRNGNYVSGFPVKLYSPAANGLTLFDYEKNKAYRLWMPLKNNTTNCYAINGKPVLDFSPVKNAGQVTRIVLQQKDYFIVTDALGNINITNRKGEARVKIKNKIEEGTQTLFIEEGKNLETTKICYLNQTDKKLYKISLTDKSEKTSIPEENTIQSVYIDTLSNPSGPLLVCTTENGIDVFDFFGKKLYALALNKKTQGPLKALSYNDKHLYATLETGTNNLLLLDIAGNTIIDTDIKLNKLPENCVLINNEKPYSLGFFGNKVFCIKQ